MRLYPSLVAGIALFLACVIALPWAGCTPPAAEIPSATSRLPIRINGNAEFTAANGVTGGDGTLSDPWTIDGWDISGHGYGYCIYIGNTTEHFIVRNCSIHDARYNFELYYFTESGVILHRVSNGTVAGNIVRSNDFDGIYLHNSSHIIVENNTITGNRWGVMLMSGSSNNTVRRNTVNASTDYGIGLIDSVNNSVTDNSVRDNANMGIFFGGSKGNSIIGNNVSGNPDGVNLDSSDGNTVAENDISGSSGTGIYLWHSTGNSIYHNNIMDNAAQARDDTGTNSWDDGFPSGGNHWSDYSGIDANADGLGDAAQPVPGGMGARDRYPFMQSWFRDGEAPVAEAGPDITVNEDVETRFNGSASKDNVGVAVYTWAFVFDGTDVVLNGAGPVHNFTIPGVFEVTLEAMDSAGNRGTDTLTVTVTDVTKPVADAGPDLAVGEGETALLNGSASTDNVGVAGYSWAFNDGISNVILDGCNATHVFSLTGVYDIELNVTDDAGNWDTDHTTVTVIGDTVPPVAEAGEDIMTNAGEIAMLNGSASHDNVGIVNYTWEFQCNGTAVRLYGPVQEWVFWVPGNYTVMLTVRDGKGNFGSDEFIVMVQDSSGLGNEPISEDDGGAGVTAAWLTIAVIAVLSGLAFGLLWVKKARR